MGLERQSMLNLPSSDLYEQNTKTRPPRLSVCNYIILVTDQLLQFPYLFFLRTILCMCKCLSCCVIAQVFANLLFLLSYPILNDKYLNRINRQIIPFLETSKLSRLPIIISSHFKLILVVSDKTIFEHISFLSGIGWLVS